MSSTANNKNRGVLLMGKVTINQGSVLGPYSSVAPVTSGNVLPDSADTGMVWDGILPALSAHTQFRSATNPKGKVANNDAEAIKTTVWTPQVGTCVQALGMLVVFVFHWIAIIPAMALFYWMFINDVYIYYFALFHFCWVWLLGIPLAMLVVLYKWVVIGRFREGPTTASLDARRWILGCLMQSRLLQSFIFYGASSPIIATFYRAMGMKVGWNAQVMPVNVLEFDLLSVGESTSFGGQVSVFCRDHEGNHKKCVMGDGCAVTNSAIMLAGSSVGAGALVGDLTLLPVDMHVDDGDKCVGNPCVRFPGNYAPPSKHVAWSNYIMFLHTMGSVVLEALSQPSWLVITFSLFSASWVQQFSPGPGGIYGYSGFVLLVVFMLLIMIGLMILMPIVFKRLTAKMVGTYQRDSWTFVQFIFMTKVIVNVDIFLYRMLGGTPWMPLIYQAMGINASLTSCLLNRHTADCDMLTVGDNAIVDFDAYLELHQKTADELSFEPIVIGDDAVIGARSILLRGSEVENSAQLHGLSMVLPGEPVLADSIWGGLPSGSYYAPSATNQLRASMAVLGGAGGNDNGAGRRTRRSSVFGAGGGRNSYGARDSVRVEKGQMHLDARMSARIERLSQAQPDNRRGSLFADGNRGSLPPMNIVVDQQDAEEVDVGMVVIGAGNMGLMAAHEFTQAGESVLVLEKTGSAMGCWRSGYGANPTSHVAVSEPAYRFPLPSTSGTTAGATTTDPAAAPASAAPAAAQYPSDYTPQPELLQQGARFIKEQGLDECIEYHCTVTDVAHISSSPPRVEVTYSNSRTGKTTTVLARGVYIAIGAQQSARELKWEGEDAFEAVPGTSVAYGVQGDIDAKTAFRGRRVVIVGNGAFAVENARTALMHGASHVTLVYRRAFQTWPRVVHYLASLGGLSFAELGEHYESWKEWAGMDTDALGEEGMDGFMSLGTFSQPSASDFIFGAHKAGMLTIRKDEVERCVADVGAGNGSGPGVVLKRSGDVLPCEVFLKCIGWRLPDLKKIMPSFETRNWCFLNSTPNVVFACDPHYQLDAHNSSDSGSAGATGSAKGGARKKVSAKVAAARHAHMMQTVPKGGTFSNIVLARATARMQLFMMTKQRAFNAAITQLPTSTNAMCSWFEQRWEFDGIPQLNQLIDEVLEEGKEHMRERFPDMDAFVNMAKDRFAHDMSQTAGGRTLTYPMDHNGHIKPGL